MKKLYLYTAYERTWHWLQAACILVLLATGLAVHFPDTFSLVSFDVAVRVHNVMAFVLVGNAALALFYHLATGQIRQFVPRPRECYRRAMTQARYYTVGIFRGEPHPYEKHPEEKFSPLQKLTYLLLLNVLLPLQVASGPLLWGVQRWPGAVDLLGGPGLLAYVHTGVAWVFAAFLVGHLYMITTGPTPSAYLEGMISGWEPVETAPDPPETGPTPGRPDWELTDIEPAPEESLA